MSVANLTIGRSSSLASSHRDWCRVGLVRLLLPLCRRTALLRCRSTVARQCALYGGHHASDRAAKDVLLFREKAKDSRYHLLLPGYAARLFQVGRDWYAGGGLWFLEPIRVS